MLTVDEIEEEMNSNKFLSNEILLRTIIDLLIILNKKDDKKLAAKKRVTKKG